MDIREHSVYFDDYNTWDMWHLVPSGRPTPSIPELRTNYVTVPGRSGSLDLSTALTGYPIYENRTLEADFILIDQEMYWMDVYMDIVKKIHGKRMKIRLVDDPGWYYEGRVVVSSFASNSDYSSVTITCTLEPYKYGEVRPDIIKLYKDDMANISTSGLDYKQLTVVMGEPYEEETGSIKNANQVLPNGSILLTKDSPVRYKTDIVYEPEISITSSRTELFSVDIWNSGTPFGVTTPSTGNISIYDGKCTSIIKGVMFANPNGSYDNTFTTRILRTFTNNWSLEDYLEIKIGWQERSL